MYGKAATIGCFAIGMEDIDSAAEGMVTPEWRPHIWELTESTLILRLCDSDIDDDTEPGWSSQTLAYIYYVLREISIYTEGPVLQ